ncbi:MAG TPA: laccase domain-containing protein, partial [Patescibacteria group bacterium]|nr:laccase domain-containing protein [Patescibacteria group bacterium]
LSRHPSSTARYNGKTYLSLQSAINEKLIPLGILSQNIFTHPDCTFCARDYLGYKYFSWRRDHIAGNTHSSIITIFPR